MHRRVERRRPAISDLVVVDGLLDLVCGRACRPQVAGGDGDLDLGG